MNSIDILGWTASILLSLCSLPQVIKIVKDGNADGTSMWFLILWAAGNICTQVYILGKFGWDFALLSKYWANDIMLMIMLKYKFLPKDQGK